MCSYQRMQRGSSVAIPAREGETLRARDRDTSKKVIFPAYPTALIIHLQAHPIINASPGSTRAHGHPRIPSQGT